ncbi:MULTISPECIES: transposase [Aerosakkonema]|uniref:transposase n=1 Tax=Aerosakkonema TaxID=1246629 RepID=UPI0035B9ECF1
MIETFLHQNLLTSAFCLLPSAFLGQAQGWELRRRPRGRTLPQVVSLKHKQLTITPHQAAWLVMRRPFDRDAEDEQLIAQLAAQHPDLSTAIDLAQDFAQLVRQRQPECLDPWLHQAGRCQLVPFQRFAQSLREDYYAVKAGVTLPTSNGPVEGHINRLKMLKRQMYGRASIDLLSRRFLWAA